MEESNGLPNAKVNWAVSKCKGHYQRFGAKLSTLAKPRSCDLADWDVTDLRDYCLVLFVVLNEK